MIALAYRLRILFRRPKISSLLRHLNADLLFCPFTAPTYFEPGIPTVCTIYDLQYKTYPQFFNPEDLLHRQHSFLEACRRASLLTAISEYSRQTALNESKLKPEKIRTIHLQMAQRILPDEHQDKTILNRFDLQPQNYFLYPANFWKHKNHEMLMTAFGIACQKKLEASMKLVFTGAKNARQDWLSNASLEMNLGDRILFLNYLSNEELALVMANSKAVIFPSLYEGFGLPIIEAMAAGVPVACSDRTSLPEIAAEAALFFNPAIPEQIAEAMIRLTQDDNLREQLILAGKARAELFSDSNRMAQAYWNLFQQAVQERNQADALSGTYEDGWVGQILSVQIAPSKSQQILELEFFAPDWLPQAKITVKAQQTDKTKAKTLEILRGNKANLSLSLPSHGGHYEIILTPTFIPSKLGYAEHDQRELSLMLQACRVQRVNGESIELISREKSA